MFQGSSLNSSVRLRDCRNETILRHNRESYRMAENGDRIGGDESEPRFVLIFAVGVVIGTIIRVGMWVLPTGFVDRVTSQLERE